MKTKQEIVANWLPRYTKRKLEDFGEYILLTNFNKYVDIFAEKFNVPVLGKDANMTSASAEGMTISVFTKNGHIELLRKNIHILVEVSQQNILSKVLKLTFCVTRQPVSYDFLLCFHKISLNLFPKYFQGAII